uniref:Aminopeptidase n=1 Tax=Denticeps clupeoides TaxID=299321 RepID=A0AAY4EEY7_9TELE
MGKFCHCNTLCVVCSVLGALAVATIVALWVVQLTFYVRPADPWDDHRLPPSLVPDSYHVTLWPRLHPDGHGMFIFTGTSRVRFNCSRDTNLILLHSDKLTLTSKDGHLVKLTAVSGSTPVIRKSWLHPTNQYLVVQLNGVLRAGEAYDLYTEFEGQLADDLEGFYRSMYNEDGVEKILATSQMHPTHARKTFPCFDEPAMKAVFHITLVHERGTVALSNGLETGQAFSYCPEVVDTVIDGSLVTRTTFEPTKRMSTYLLALVVSDYSNVRIWARKKAIDADQGELALNLTGSVLNFLETYYDIPYPLSKSDHIALPDFYFGAMENWGLVTYKEANLLYDVTISSNGDRETTASIIAHEMAHMWFGNLVTLKWWNEVWLNEGFATYVSYLGADYAEPTWDIKDLFVLNEVHRVFTIDALATSHPLSSEEESIQTPAQIAELFDAISYSKVGWNLKKYCSQHHWIDSKPKNQSTYLTSFAYGNTESSDLWEHLQQVNNNGISLPGKVNEIMNHWTLQMGFPVVTIDTRMGQLSQTHFLLDPESKPKSRSEFNYEWIVPIQWRKSSQEISLTWLSGRHALNNNMKTSGDEWLLANINITGYFRVNYDSENWDRLLNQLNTDHKVLPVINRAQLIDDAFNLARANIIPISLALNTTRYLHQETGYIPWKSALNNFDYLYLMFGKSDIYILLQRYLKKQVEPLFLHFKNITLDWVNVPEEHSDQYNQVNALWVACSTGVDGCQNLTRMWFRQWMEQPEISWIHPNLRATVYCSAIAEGGTEEWDFAWKMMKNSSVASESDKLRAALSCSRDTWLLNRYLNFTLDQDKIRKQDATSTIVSIARSVHGQMLAWDFVRRNWEYMFTQYGVGSFSFASLISGVTASFSTEEELSQLLQFKMDNAAAGFGSATTALEQALERTRANIRWVSGKEQEIRSWFLHETSSK